MTACGVTPDCTPDPDTLAQDFTVAIKFRTTDDDANLLAMCLPFAAGHLMYVIMRHESIVVRR